MDLEPLNQVKEVDSQKEGINKVRQEIGEACLAQFRGHLEHNRLPAILQSLQVFSNLNSLPATVQTLINEVLKSIMQQFKALFQEESERAAFQESLSAKISLVDRHLSQLYNLQNSLYQRDSNTLEPFQVQLQRQKFH